MVGRQGVDSVRRGKDNRNMILSELMKEPAHFSALKKRLSMSNVTLSKHLKTLLDEGRLKRQVEGRKIVYVVVDVKKSMLDLRVDCRNELALLLLHYGVCLTKETMRKLGVALDDLEESIEKRKQDVDVADKMMGVSPSPLDKEYVGWLKTKPEKEGSEPSTEGED